MDKNRILRSLLFSIILFLQPINPFDAIPRPRYFHDRINGRNERAGCPMEEFQTTQHTHTHAPFSLLSPQFFLSFLPAILLIAITSHPLFPIPSHPHSGFVSIRKSRVEHNSIRARFEASIKVSPLIISDTGSLVDDSQPRFQPVPPFLASASPRLDSIRIQRHYNT